MRLPGGVHPVLIMLLLTVPAGAWAAQDDARSLVVVGFRDLPTDRAAFARGLGGNVAGAIDELSALVVEVPAARAGRARSAAVAHGALYASPERVAQAAFAPDDMLYPQQWAPAAVGLPQAWDLTRGGHDRVIAVLDTGIDRTHADLLANVCGSGMAFLSGTGTGVFAATQDDNGHGTHVAGIAAAANDNQLGVAGAAQACLLPVKVLNSAGRGFYADVAAGIVWATNNGADVITLSLGGTSADETLEAAVRYAQARGVLVVASAGNEGCGRHSTVTFPARYADLAVTSLATPTDLADSASCGAEVDVAAPGVGILSTFAGNAYLLMSGTSMAAPLVAGSAALAWSCNPSASAATVAAAARQTADDLAAPAAAQGAGRLDAYGLARALGC